MNRYKRSFFKHICLVIVFFVIIIGYYCYNKSRENYNYLKIDRSKNLVYTFSKTKADGYYQYKPYVNIKGDFGTLINNNIDEFINEYSKDNFCITYDTDLNGKVLSLVIKVEDYGYLESSIVLYFKSYNIDLDSLELLSNDNLLNYFDMNISDVENKLDKKINDYYSNFLEKGFINSDCDYSCFLRNQNIDMGIDNLEYFVRDGKLVVYKPFTYRIYDSELNNHDYGFVLTN